MSNTKKLTEVHKKCSRNIGDLKTPETRCACFYCQNMFPASLVNKNDTIRERDGGETIRCPYCSVDSVLVEQEDLHLTVDLIKAMHKAYFETFE